MAIFIIVAGPRLSRARRARVVVLATAGAEVVFLVPDHVWSVRGL